MTHSSTKQSSTITIGIDLGTTFSCVGIFHNDHVEIIPNEDGHRTIPSYVSFTDTGDILIGHSAKRRAIQYPKQTIYGVKRFIGKSFSDPTVQKDIEYMGYDIVQGEHDTILCKVPIQNEIHLFKPEDISSILLKKIKEFASNYLDQDVHNAVITVPAYFNDSQRHATNQAGLLAGLNVLRIINEPTAASIAYGLKNIKLHKDVVTNILVFDLGGGTFDVSIVSLEDGLFQVLATCGDTHLGGEDFDNILIRHCIDVFKQKYYTHQTGDGILSTIENNAQSMMTLKKKVEEAKKILSSSLSHTIEIIDVYGGHDLNITITRELLESLIEDQLYKCIKPIQQVLSDADVDRTHIHEIVLVGGSTRIPLLQSLISKEFMNKALCQSINPDEAVAYGASIQGALLSKVKSPLLHNVLLLDVSPLSIGIKTVGGIMNVMIPRNSTIPIKENKIFSTSVDNQSFVHIEIYEGERLLVVDNNLLGTFTICDIEPALRGQPKIEVELCIDSNGILIVSAKDLNTGYTKSIHIDHSINRLSGTNIQQQLKESKENKKEDEHKKCIIMGKYNLEKISYEYMKLLDTTNSINETDSITIHSIIKETLQLIGMDDITKDMIVQQENKIKNKIDPIIQNISTL